MILVASVMPDEQPGELAAGLRRELALLFEDVLLHGHEGKWVHDIDLVGYGFANLTRASRSVLQNRYNLVQLEEELLPIQRVTEQPQDQQHPTRHQHRQDHGQFGLTGDDGLQVRIVGVTGRGRLRQEERHDAAIDHAANRAAGQRRRHVHGDRVHADDDERESSTPRNCQTSMIR